MFGVLSRGIGGWATLPQGPPGRWRLLEEAAESQGLEAKRRVRQPG